MTNCTGCNRRLPIHNGIHCGEWHMERCTAQLELVPMHESPKERDTWYRPDVRVDVPFRFGGGV